MQKPLLWRALCAIGGTFRLVDLAPDKAANAKKMAGCLSGLIVVVIIWCVYPRVVTTKLDTLSNEDAEDWRKEIPKLAR